MRRSYRYEGTDGLCGGYSPYSSVTNLSRQDFIERNRLSVDKLECHVECLILIGTAIMSAALPGTVAVAGTAAAAGVAAAGSLGVITATTAAIVGGAAVIGGVAAIGIAANQMGQSQGRSEAYNEMAGAVGTTAVDNTVGGISETEMRRRAALANAKNNMTNVLTGASSESSTAPTVKSTLGNTDLADSAVIGSTNL